MLNSTKGISVAIDFMITCPLHYPRRHTISIPLDIIVPILRTPVATSVYQQWPNP